MIIQFTARHFNASESLQTTVTDQVRELTRFYENIISAHVILDTEDKTRKSAEIVLRTKNKSIAGKATDEKMGAAIDNALSKVERQLKKQHDKLTSHHKDRRNKRQLPETASLEEDRLE